MDLMKLGLLLVMTFVHCASKIIGSEKLVNVSISNQDAVMNLEKLDEQVNILDMWRSDSRSFRVLVKGDGTNVTIWNVKSKLIVAKTEFTRSSYNETLDSSATETMNLCFLTGEVVGEANSAVSLKVCDELAIQVQTRQRAFSVSSNLLPTGRRQFKLNMKRDYVIESGTNSTVNSMPQESVHIENVEEGKLQRVKKTFQIPMRHIEAYFVIDHLLAAYIVRQRKGAIRYLKAMVFHANWHLARVNYNIAIKGIKVFPEVEGLPFAYTKKRKKYVSEAILNSFQGYLTNTVRKSTSFDVGILLTSADMVGSVTREVKVNTMCEANAGIVVKDFGIGEIWRTANTLVFAIGRILGVSYPSPGKCKCPIGKKCIMTKVLKKPDTESMHWTECDIGHLRQTVEEDNSKSCLKNKPILPPEYQVCGNFIVENDEECDCGHITNAYFVIDRDCLCCVTKTCKKTQVQSKDCPTAGVNTTTLPTTTANIAILSVDNRVSSSNITQQPDQLGEGTNSSARAEQSTDDFVSNGNSTRQPGQTNEADDSSPKRVESNNNEIVSRNDGSQQRSQAAVRTRPRLTTVTSKKIAETENGVTEEPVLEAQRASHSSRVTGSFILLIIVTGSLIAGI